ncbi:hypothetical protein ACSQ67_025324 [Phaseolus vulgaris]
MLMFVEPHFIPVKSLNFFNLERVNYTLDKSIHNDFKHGVTSKVVRVFTINIAKAEHLKKEGPSFSNQWVDNSTIEEVDTLLYGIENKRHGDDLSKSSNLLPLGIVVHNTVFNMFLQRTSSLDNVLDNDRSM